MTESENIYWSVVEHYIAPSMRELGFKRVRKDWFYATDEECTKRLTSGFAKQRGKDAVTMFVTVCVGFTGLREFLADCKDLLDHVNLEREDRPCTMATDLGHLAPPFQHLTWTITPRSDIDEIGKEIVLRIRRDGIKYFSDYGSLERAAEAWRHGTTYNMGGTALLYLAAYEWLHGSKERALFDLRDGIISSSMPSSKHVYTCLLHYLESKVTDDTKHPDS